MRNTIHFGDFREHLCNIPDGVVDGVFTDPPFNIDLNPQRGTHGTIENDALSTEQFQQLIADFAATVYRILKPNSVAWVCCNWQCVSAIAPEMEKAGFSIKTWVVWDKMMFGIGSHFRPQHEFILPCFKGEPPFPENKGDANVWRHMRLIETIHPNEKPVQLVQHALRKYNKEGDWIVDPFAGSFVTCVAAKALGMDYTACELKEIFYDQGVKRLSETTFTTANAKGKKIQRQESNPLLTLFDE